MNLQQIRTFHAVMTSQSMSDAAKKLGRTQPAVSASLKALEAVLNVRLFERDGRSLIPTPEAVFLLSEAEEMIGQLQRINRTMQGMSSGTTGSITAVTMPGPSAVIFPRFLSRHMGVSADVSVSLSTHSSGQIEDMAKAQMIDFGFGDAPKDGALGRLFDCDVLTGQCFVIVNKDHALARQDSISLSDLDGVALGTLQRDHALRAELGAAMAERGAALTVSVECQIFLPILEFVQAGRCASVVDPLSVCHVQALPTAYDSVCIRPLSDPLAYQYGTYWPIHRPVSTVAKALGQSWTEEVRRLLEGLNATYGTA